MDTQGQDEVKKNSNKKKKLSSNKKAGIAIGVVAFLIVLGAVGSHKNTSTPIDVQQTSQKSTSATSKSPNLTITSPAPATTTTPQTTSTSPASTAPSQTTSPPASTTPSCSPVSDAASMEGTSGCINFTGYAYTSSRGEMYLDQYLSAPYGFSAYIPAGTSFGPSVLSQYSGQSVDVTGTITNYKGEPEMIISSASQIQLAQ